MPEQEFLPAPHIPSEVWDAIKESQASAEAASGASGPFKAGNTLASLTPKQVEQIASIPLAEPNVEARVTYDSAACTDEGCFCKLHPGEDCVHEVIRTKSAEESEEPASDELPVEISLDMLFSLYEDISDRITVLEDRIALFNTKASHKL